MKIALNAFLTIALFLSSINVQASQLLETIDNFFDRKTCFLLVAATGLYVLSGKRATANPTMDNSDILNLQKRIEAQDKEIEALKKEQKETKDHCTDLIKRLNAFSDIVSGRAMQSHSELYAMAIVGAVNGICDSLDTKKDGKLDRLKGKFQNKPQALKDLDLLQKSIDLARKEADTTLTLLLKISSYHNVD